VPNTERSSQRRQLNRLRRDEEQTLDDCGQRFLLGRRQQIKLAGLAIGLEVVHGVTAGRPIFITSMPLAAYRYVH
jgi:hypothetical protein